MPPVSIETSPLLIIPAALILYAISTIAVALMRTLRRRLLRSATPTSLLSPSGVAHTCPWAGVAMLHGGPSSSLCLAPTAEFRGRRPRRVSRAIAVSAALLIASCLNSSSAQAFALRLTGPFGDARGAFRTASVLFYGDMHGRIEQIERIGDFAPDGGTVVDLGVPAMMPDGRILIGAEVQNVVEIVGTPLPPRWELLSIDPNRRSAARTTAIIPSAASSPDCSPSLNVDPYPVADDHGAILFAAPAQQGRDAVFVAAQGEISCLARVGDQTDKGRRVKTFAFGTVQAAGDRQVAMLAVLEGDRNAVLLVSRQGLTELAVEGETSPQGDVFGHHFGLPAISASRDGVEIAFTNNTRAGGALFVHRNGATSKTLAVGAATSAGKLGFLSPGRPAMDAGGRLAVMGACDRAPAIFVLDRDQHSTAVKVGAASKWGLSDLGDPSITETGAVLFGAINSAQREQLYLLSSGEKPSAFRLTQFTPQSHSTAAAPGIFSGTLTTNARGQFAFLGGG